MSSQFQQDRVEKAALEWEKTKKTLAKQGGCLLNVLLILLFVAACFVFYAAGLASGYQQSSKPEHVSTP